MGGNRGIYFGKIKTDENQLPVDVVIKVASLSDMFSDDEVLYRYYLFLCFYITQTHKAVSVVAYIERVV